MIRKFAINILKTFGIVILFALTVVPRAFAVQEGDLGAYPSHYDPDNPKTKSWFIYDLKAGQTKEDSITVVNNSDKSLDVKIYPVDATTTSDGAFALLNNDQPQKEIGSWVKLSKDLITIGPKDRKDVPFTISLPSNVTVGDHAGGIIVQEAKKPTIATSGMGLNIVSRVGTRIYETVPGNQIVSLDVRDLSYTIKDNHLVFTFVMENRGNIILTPTGNFQIKDGSGKVFETIPLGNLGAVFPGKPTTITVTSKKDAPSFGQYIATVTVNYSSLKSITKSLTFFLFFHDWSVILPVLLLLLLIILFIIIKKYLSRKHKFQQIAQPEISTNKPQSASFAAKNISGENVDQVFIAHHIKLLGVAVLISVLVLSSLFAFILKDFVFSPIMPHAQGSSTQSTVPSNAPLSKQNTVPTETSIPINKADMKVIILNASGKAGVAKALGQKLSKDGFSVAKIANAEGTSTQTVIQYPIGKNEETDLLMEELKNEYASVTKEASDSAVFTIIIGK